MHPKMKNKKRHWFWNLVIVLTLFVCLLAFVVHYQNWYKVKDGEVRILSGIYYKTIPLSDIDSLVLVDKIPEMERSHGFSWLSKEKGVFKDSLTGGSVYVFVDDLKQQKIKLVHNDSLRIYFNFADSLKTRKVHFDLDEQLALIAEQK